MTDSGQSVFVLEVGFPPEGPRTVGVFSSFEAAVRFTGLDESLWDQGGDDWWQVGRGPQLRVLTRYRLKS